MLNLNPDLSGAQLKAQQEINESLGLKSDEVASTPDGSFSLVSLIKRSLQLLASFSVPSKATTTHLEVSDSSVVLVEANLHTKEVVIYNTGKFPVAICLGQSPASFLERSYSLGPGVLVVEAFSGKISAISSDSSSTEVIVTVKS